MRRFILLLSAMLAWSGCDSRAADSADASKPQPHGSPTAELRAKLKAITLADGISRSEADLIARCYFDRHVGCGAYKGIRDGGAHWIVKGAFGFGGYQIERFHIAKRNGKIIAGTIQPALNGKPKLSRVVIGPSYASPLEIYP